MPDASTGILVAPSRKLGHLLLLEISLCVIKRIEKDKLLANLEIAKRKVMRAGHLLVSPCESTLPEPFGNLKPFPSHELAKVNGIDPVVVILKVIPTLAAGHRIGEGTVDLSTRTLETETTVDSFDLILFELHGLILAGGFRILKPFLGLSDFRL